MASDTGSADIVAEIFRNVFPSGGAAAVIIIILAEALQYIMATLDYLRNKWVKPIIERHRAEGVVAGRAAGRAEGQAEMSRQWQRWLERREAAEQAGLPFDEPPPEPTDPD